MNKKRNKTISIANTVIDSKLKKKWFMIINNEMYFSSGQIKTFLKININDNSGVYINCDK